MSNPGPGALGGSQPITIPAGPNNGGGLQMIDPSNAGTQVAIDPAITSQGILAANYLGLTDSSVVYGIWLLTTASLPGGVGCLEVDNPAGTLRNRLFFGWGVPNNVDGSNNDVYLRFDGGAGATLYQKRAGAWVAIL